MNFGKNILCYGTVAFEAGQYKRESGGGDWKVLTIPFPLLGLGAGEAPPLGMVKIEFDSAAKNPYTIVVSPRRLPTTPSITANYGDQDETGFVVYFSETAADRTVQNASFSFLVIQDSA